MVQTAETIFRDFVTDGVPASGRNNPNKPAIREWGAWLEGLVTAFTSNGGLIYTSKTSIDGDLAHDAKASAWVVGDVTVANNGIYQKQGASGAGSWLRVADLPYSFIRASNAGAGTANAIIATSSIPIPVADGAALILVNITVANTGSATVAFNGGAAISIKTSSGSDVLGGYLVAGSIVAGVVAGGSFRLLSDISTLADRAAAEAAASSASGSATNAATSATNAATYDPTFRYKTVADLLASTRAAGGAGTQWQAGEFLYEEAPTSIDPAITTTDGVKLDIAPQTVAIWPEMFGAKADGVTDDTAAIIAAEAYCYTNQKELRFSARQYCYSDDITFRCEVFGAGVDTSWLVKTAPATIYHEEGAFKGVKIAPLTEEVLSGDTTDGFVMTGLSRKDVLVRTEYHGGNGFVFESGNLSRAVVYSRWNGGRGIWLPIHATGDNNCLDIWAETTRNGLAGFEIESSGTDTQKANCVKGFIIAQNNSEALVDTYYNVDLAGFEHDLVIYCETGNSARLRSTLKSSRIFFQVAQFTTMLDETVDDTNVISYTGGARGDRRVKKFRVEDIVVKKQSRVGNLRLSQTADREFTLAMEGTGSASIIKLAGPLTFQNPGGQPYAASMYVGGSLNFGTIGANAIVERTLTLPGTPTNPVVSAMPRFAVPAGIMWCAYIDEAAPTTVVIRCHNITGAGVAVSGAWRATAVSA